MLTVLPIEDRPVCRTVALLEDVFYEHARGADSSNRGGEAGRSNAPKRLSGNELPGPAAPVASTGSHEPLASETTPVIRLGKISCRRQDASNAGTRVMHASPRVAVDLRARFHRLHRFLQSPITTEVEGRWEVASVRPVVKNDATNQGSASFMPDVDIKSDATESVAPSGDARESR